MNIYLLHIGYIIGVLGLSLLITYLLCSLSMWHHDEADTSNTDGAPTLIIALLVCTVLLLLSYY